MYVDGFIVPVKTARKAEYAAMSRAVAAVFIKHGATRVTECWADDVKPGKLTSFPQAVMLEDDETAVFSWIEFPDKGARDACYEQSFKDPAMPDMSRPDIVAGPRMIFGGFELLIDERANR